MTGFQAVTGKTINIEFSRGMKWDSNNVRVGYVSRGFNVNSLTITHLAQCSLHSIQPVLFRFDTPRVKARKTKQGGQAI